MLDFCWAEASPKAYDLFPSRPPRSCLFFAHSEQTCQLFLLHHAQFLFGGTDRTWGWRCARNCAPAVEGGISCLVPWGWESGAADTPAAALALAHPQPSLAFRSAYTDAPVGLATSHPRSRRRRAPRLSENCPLLRCALQSIFPGFLSLGVCGSQGDSGELACGYPEPAWLWSPQAFPGLRARLVLRLSAFCPTNPGSLSFPLSVLTFCHPEDELF